MKNVLLRVVVLLMLLSANGLLYGQGKYKYYFVPVSNNFQGITFTLKLHPSDETIVINGNTTIIKELNERVESFDVIEHHQQVAWHNNMLYTAYVDRDGHFLAIYFDPNFELSVTDTANTTNLNNTTISTDDFVRINVNRNEYIGDLPVYLSESSTVTEQKPILLRMPNAPSYVNETFNDLWDKLLDLYGNVNNILTKPFYLRTLNHIKVESNGNIFETYVYSNPAGPFYLDDGLKATTSAEDVVSICGKLQLEPSHLRPPYTVSFSQYFNGETHKENYDCEDYPVIIDYAILSSLGLKTLATDIYIYKDLETLNTETITKTFLGLKPDTTGMTKQLSPESCEDEEDGKIEVFLPAINSNYKLRPTIIGITDPKFISNSGDLLPAGIYNLQLEYTYQNGDQVGCYIDVGNFEILRAPKLTINDIESFSEICSYTDDAKIIIHTENGIGDIHYEVAARGTTHTYNESNIYVNSGVLYTITAIDIVGCRSDQKEVRVDSVPSLKIEIANLPINCFADSVQATLKGTGGTGSLQFLSEGDTIQNNGTAYFQGDLHQTYRLELIDANNCREIREVSFVEPDLLEFQSEPFIAWDLRCHNDNSGKITLHGQGGTYKIYGHLFSQSDSSYAAVNDTTFTGLSAQSYNAYLSDANGCLSDTVKGITLTEPEGINFTHITSHPETCNGTLDAGIIVTLSGTADSLQWYRYSNQLLSGQNGPELSNVGPGTYELEAFYNNSTCVTKTDPIQIANTEAINFTTAQHVSCSDGIGGGQIKLAMVSYARQPITYVLDNNDPQPLTGTPTLFSNLDAGVHTLEIRDSAYIKGGIFADRCKTSKSVTIIPKNRPEIETDNDRPLCYGDSNGSLTVTSLTGDDNPVVHEWLNATNNIIGSGNLLSNIPAGQYSAVILDTFQCKTLHTGFVLDEPARLVISNLDVENAACTEVSDGILSITALGGTAPYQYSANGGLTWQTNPTLPNLASSNYHIHVRDHNQCAVDSGITIGAFNPLISAKCDSVTCYNAADGTFTLSASGSKSQASGYQYYLLGNSTPVSTGIFSELDAGTYRFYALDQEGCYTDTITGIMYEPPPMHVDLTLRDSASCSQYTGKIGYNVSGGNGNYSLKWFNSAIGETTYLDTSALRTGTYTLTATDRKQCEASDVVFVPDRPAPVITGITQLEQTWCGKPLGAAKVDVTSGSPRYSYQWNNEKNDTLAVADSLKAGTYRVVVTDRYNCTDEAQITLIDGPAISMTILVGDPHCGQNDGQVELSVTGGVYPYLFHWPDSVSSVPLTDSSMSTLFAGIYPVTISDGVGCEKVFPVTLKDLDGPSIDHVSIISSWCGLPVGKARALVSKGTRPYSYNWMPSGTSVSLGHDSLITTLKAGDYHILVTDVHNCKTVESITVADSTELQPHLAMVKLDSAACDKPLGKIRVTTGNGLAPYSYAWNTGAVSDSVVNITRGTYRVVSTDGRGCRDSLEIELSDRKAPVITFVSKESAYCGRPLGKATVAASLGSLPYHTYLVDNPGNRLPLAYNPLTGKYTATIDSLLPLPSAYRIRVSDANGCESPDLSVIIDDDNPMSLTLLDISPVSCHGGNDGRAVVRAGNGFEPYTYEWSVNSVNNDTNMAMPAGIFDVTVTDAKSCVKTLYVTATPIAQPAPLTLGSSFITHPACHGICDARIEATATGGNGNYIYVWNNTDTAQTGTALCAGENTLKIIDSKGCIYTGSFRVIDPEPLHGTDLPAEITMCSGQHYLADPGDEWTGVSWTSDNAFASDMHVADIDMQGTYYMTGYSDKGCLVQDTIKVIISDDLLDAQFLMMSQAYAGDTVVIIEVSWPVADQYKWEFPESANIIYDHENYKELVFDLPGTYYIELTASLAGCSSIKGKYIEVIEAGDENVDPIPAEDPALIKSFGVYPNPASREFNVEVKLAEESDIRFEIISLSTGQPIRIMNNYGLNDYLVPVNIDQLTPGSYVIRLVAGKESKTKILIVR